MPCSYRLATCLFSLIPHTPLYYFGQAAGFCHYLLARGKREGYLSNVSCLPKRPARSPQPWKAFQNHALNVMEILKAHSETGKDILKRVSLSGRENLDLSLRQGKGIVLSTFHFGNWELSGLSLALSGYSITTVAGEQLRRAWSDEVKNWKRRHGIKVLSPGSSLRSLYRDLEANRIVVLHIDGNLFSRGIGVRFLGRRVSFPAGPARLSRATGAPIALAYCRRTGRKNLDVIVRKPFPPPRSDGEEEAVTISLVREVEKCILAEPEQWCIFRKLQDRTPSTK